MEEIQFPFREVPEWCNASAIVTSGGKRLHVGEIENIGNMRVQFVLDPPTKRNGWAYPHASNGHVLITHYNFRNINDFGAKRWHDPYDLEHTTIVILNSDVSHLLPPLATPHSIHVQPAVYAVRPRYLAVLASASRYTLDSGIAKHLYTRKQAGAEPSWADAFAQVNRGTVIDRHYYAVWMEARDGKLIEVEDGPLLFRALKVWLALEIAG